MGYSEGTPGGFEGGSPCSAFCLPQAWPRNPNAPTVPAAYLFDANPASPQRIAQARPVSREMRTAIAEMRTAIAEMRTAIAEMRAAIANLQLLQ